MKKFFSLLSLLVCISIGQVWGAADVTYDFTGSGWTVSNGTLSNGTVSFTGAGSDNFKMSSGYFMLGKSGAYINFPTYSKAVEKIVVTGRSGASASTKMNIYVGQTAVSTETTGSTGTNTYNIASASQAAGTTYTLKVTSSHNAQITKIEIFYAAEVPAGTCATPTFSLDEGTYEGTQSVTISCSTTGATIYYTTDGTTPSTSSSVYFEAIEVAADMTIKAYAVKAGSTDSEVATATYTITEGPDVTLNLIDGNWSFPTKDATTLKEYTNSETGYAVSCYATTAYKSSGSYFIIGKSGSYILLPEFANPVEKIVVVGNPGGSAAVVFNIYDGNDAASTAVTGCTSDQTFVITNPAANKQYTLRITSAHNLQLKAIKIYYGAAPDVASPTISGEASFVTSTEVSLSCSTNGATIYYTTNGNDPKTSGTAYSTPFTLTDGATVKAAAKVGNDWSAVAEKTFTKVTPLTTMAAVQAAAESTEKGINVTISNWVVTAVNNSQVWITDANNEKGIILYKSGHGFEAGNKINGTVIGTKIKLYNDYPELTTLAASDVTVTTADAVTPRVTTIADLTSGFPAEQGTIVKLEDVTYNGSAFSDGVNTITIDTRFVTPTLVNDATYNLTGVVFYGSNHVIKIIPRTADDVVAQSAVVIPTAANLAALKAAARGTYILTLTNAVVTYADDKNAFIEDATAGALIYYQNGGHGFSAGDCLNGDYQVTATDYQGKFEITAIEAQTGAEKTTADVPLITVTIATLNADFASYESRRVKIAGADVTDGISGSDRNGTINDGAELAVYASVANTITLTAENNVDIIGYPGFHNTDQQLTVWAQTDITVNGGDTPTPAEGDNVVILAQYDSKYYAMSTTLNNKAFEAIEVEYDGTQVTVKSEAEKTAIQWTKATSNDGTTFQDANSKYLAHKGTGTDLQLADDAENWTLHDDGYYYAVENRTFLYYKDGIFKNYASTNIGKSNSGYSDKAQVIAIAAENIVISSKVSAELAYSPASVELTVGDEFTPATLTYAQGFDGLAAVTYESSNTNLATVEGGVVSLVADATGTATITATFAGNNNYQAGSASYTITVNAAASPASGATYSKVTSTSDITDGEYLIVYEATSVAFNGALETLDAAGNTVDVVISEGKIAGNAAIDAAVFTIDVTAGTLQSASGQYIGVSSNSNGLKTSTDASTYKNTFAISDGNAVITADFEGSTTTLRYNKASDNLRFRYYKSGQQDIQLYKKESAQPVEPEEPVLNFVELRSGLNVNSYYTVCMDKNILAVRGATFWSLNNRAADGSEVYFEEATAPYEAGKPYIYYTSSSTVEVAYGDETAVSPVANGALRGTFEDMNQAAINAASTANGGSDIYIVSSNQLWQVAGRSNNSLGANRAYIVYNDLVNGEPAPVAGRRVIRMPMQGNTATGIDGLNVGTAETKKVILNGQFFIIREGKTYDVTGCVVK